MKYRKRPIEVEARVWLPDDELHAGQTVGWINVNGGRAEVVRGLGGQSVLGLNTTAGVTELIPGDVAVRGPAGEWFAMTFEEFAAKYEAVAES